ncbi:uncharacterized protein LOC18769511 [Prunus persica]|uniref:uncharacterized protein LOC18769511 n=1 Tax=Prunus persica TaxID=3760 RepID=UPI0009AB6000|nr:uncharacterized protein LOC18769511 [Prunus persica]
MGSNPPLLPPICEEQPHSESQRVESESLRDESQRANFDQEVDTNSLERDPGLHPRIDTFPPNQHDNVRRAYILLGPCQLKLKEYPSHLEGKQMHRFNDGFRNWRRVGGKECAFLTHVGIINSPHHFAIQKWMDLKNPTHHIDRVVQPPQEVAKNRLRLTTTKEAIRYLANQGMAFRGDDESHDSFNRIQKEIRNIYANKVRKRKCNEIGEDRKFCILINEALDDSKKEQMAIIIRFVSCDGHIRERFYDIVSVHDTNSSTLKSDICKVFSKHSLLVSNMRGQGYDGASDMHGEWSDLQALFLNDCPYAYYIHCFTHRLQLALNAAAKEVGLVWRFFSMLNNIVNFVGTSAKRHSELKLNRQAEIEDLLAAGRLGTSKGANQIRCLQRPRTTRWGSHFSSIRSLIDLFGATKTLLKDINHNGPTSQFRGEAEDYQLGELNTRFSYETVELLRLSSSLDPRDAFKQFNIDDIYTLAEKFYPQDFSTTELHAFNQQLGFYKIDMDHNPTFKNLYSIPILLEHLVETRLAQTYYLIDRLICLVLTLPISTTTIERAFSCMRLIKNRLRNKIDDEFLADCMLLHIEREFADNIDN